MPVRTTRYDSADYIATEEGAVAFAGAVLEEPDGLGPPEDILATVARGLGLAAIARITGLGHDAVCMSLKAGDLLPGEATAWDVLRALAAAPRPGPPGG